MSTKGNRDYRPAFHYAPPFGWINDPNGLTYENGVWHLFAQYYPDEPIWGPMHWCHATSNDLLNWQHHGVALAVFFDVGFNGVLHEVLLKLKLFQYFLPFAHCITLLCKVGV